MVLIVAPCPVGDRSENPTPGAPPPILIEALLPGQSPQPIIESVTKPLEKAFAGFEGASRISSLSFEGRCLLRLEMNPSADYKKAREAAAKRLLDAKPKLPEACVRAGLKILPEENPSFVVLALSAPGFKELIELSTLVRDTIRPRLERLPHVSHVQVLGEGKLEIHIMCDPDRLTRFGLQTEGIVSALKKVTKDPPKDAQELSDVEVGILNGQPVQIRDLAQVVIGMSRHGPTGTVFRKEKNATEMSNYAVMCVIQLRPGNSVDFPKSLDQVIKEIKGTLPAAVRLDRQFVNLKQTMVLLRLPPGSKLEDRSRIARAMAEAAFRLPQLRGVNWYTSRDVDDIYLYLWPEADVDGSTPTRGPVSDAESKLQTALRSELSKLEMLGGSANRVLHLRPARPINSLEALWPGEGSQLVVRISGDPFHEIRQTAQQLHLRMSEIEGVVDLQQSLIEMPKTDFQIDRTKCNNMGLKPADVTRMFQIYQEGIEIEGLKVGGRPTLFEFPKSEGNLFVGLRELSVVNNQGNRIPVGTVAAVRTLSAPRSLYREDGNDCIVVSCNVLGRTPAEVRKEVRKIVQELTPKGVRVQLD
jgi:multidrug efflux pump subunit AcrB